MDIKLLEAEWDKVKVHLMSEYSAAFLSSLLFSLKLVWDKNIPTAATNGMNIIWNPDFFLSLNKKERLGVTLHETLHVAFDHVGRMENISKHDWPTFQKAADYVINQHLKDQGFSLPSFVLFDVKYKGWSTEAVFEDLKANGDNTPQPMQCVMPGYGEPDGQVDPMQSSHIQDMLVRAEMMSRMSNEKPGSIPAEIELILKRLREPEIPWTQILMRKVAGFDKSLVDWKRPRRRFMPEYLPSRKGERVEGIKAYCDISGSVSDEQFSGFIGELAGVFKFRKPKYIDFAQFNTEIVSHHHAETINELLKIKFQGRGGTDVHEVFEDIKKGPKNRLNFIFTDGGFYFHNNYPHGHRIIWLINDNPNWKAEHGDVIHFSTEKYTK